MNSKDEAFLEKLRITFRIEAEEHLKALTDGLLLLEKNIPVEKQTEVIEKIFRESHSLKGASRSVNHYAIQEICQALEDLLAGWKINKIIPSPELFDVLHATIGLLEKELSGESNSEKKSEIILKLSSFQNVIQKPFTKIEKPQLSKIEDVTPKNIPSAPLDKTIRISLSKLDVLFQEVEELLMVKLASQQELISIQNIFVEISKTEKDLARFVSNIQLHRQSDNQSPDFFNKMITFFESHKIGVRSLREKINKMLKGSDQNAHFVGSMVDTLLEDMKKILMQPVSTLFDTFPRMVRDISRELGKEIQLEFIGGEIEVDRRILEEIKDPIIHIIRNAIDHGIESPEDRKQKNKNPIGKITVLASESHGSSVEIKISDDGRAFNTEKLKKVAIQKNMLSSKEAENISREDTLKLAFQSGISTSSIITEISGRGIGLGVVTEKVDKLGGHIAVESVPDKGTTFTLSLPLTMATFRGIHITVEGEDFIMPAHNVQRVIRIKEEDIKTVESFETLNVNDHSLSFLRLADLLGIKKKKRQSDSKDSMIALIVRAEEKTIAFGADYIHREHEVLLKSLGSQCPRVKNVMAATIMDWGKVIPILNPIDLVRAGIKG